jgi:hypothetical protein
VQSLRAAASIDEAVNINGARSVAIVRKSENVDAATME